MPNDVTPEAVVPPSITGRSSAPSDMELKLLDSALHEQESARDALLRDFKLTLLFVLAFHFLVSHRFVRLTGEAQTAQKTIQELSVKQKVAQDVQAGLEQLRSVLALGEKRLTKRLQEMPERLKGHMHELDSEVAKLVHRAPERPISLAVQAPLQDSTLTMLAALSSSEKEQLRTAYGAGDQGQLRLLLTPIVRTDILEPAFAALNAESGTLLTIPFQTKVTEVTSLVKGNSAQLTNLGLAPAATIDQLRSRQVHLVNYASAFLIPISGGPRSKRRRCFSENRR